MNVSLSVLGTIRRSPEVALGLLGGLLTLLYATGLTAHYPLAGGLQTPGASWTVLAQGRVSAILLIGAVYGLATCGYVGALRLALRPTMPQRMILVIVAAWVLCSVALLGVFPGDSTDVFDYAFRGRMLAATGLSPLAVVPAQVANQPFYAYVHWTHVVDTYGPLWEYLSGAVAAVTMGVWRAPTLVTLAATITVYRLLSVALAGACGAVIAAIVRRTQPDWVPAALVLWLWNPLLLDATAIGAHNDMPMLLCVLLALLLVQRAHWVWALVALALAAHVKLTALLVLPLLLLHMARRIGWRRAVSSAGLALVITGVLSWLLYAPLGGWGTLPRMLAERTRLLANSWSYIAYWALEHSAGWAEPDAQRVASGAATALFGGLAAWLLWHFWRAPRHPVSDDARLWRYAMLLTLAYLVAGAFWFQHWYGLWMLAPAALLPDEPAVWRLAPITSLAALWLHLTIDLTLTPAASVWHDVIGIGALVLVMLVGGGTALHWSLRPLRRYAVGR